MLIINAEILLFLRQILYIEAYTVISKLVKTWLCFRSLVSVDHI